MYSLPYTHVLGFVACRVTSKRLGIGAVERSWSDKKMIKDEKRSNLSGDSLEKQAILCTSAHLEEARIRSEHKCSNVAISLQMRIWSKLPKYFHIYFVKFSHNFYNFAVLTLN